MVLSRLVVFENFGILSLNEKMGNKGANYGRTEKLLEADCDSGNCRVFRVSEKFWCAEVFIARL